MIDKTFYCYFRHKKFKEKALKVTPVISSAKKCTVDRFQSFPLKMKQWLSIVIAPPSHVHVCQAQFKAQKQPLYSHTRMKIEIVFVSPMFLFPFKKMIDLQFNV